MSETSDLFRDEGCKLFVYDDATGKILEPGDKLIGHPTIAVGRNVGLGGEGLTAGEVRIMLADDLFDINKTLGTIYPWWVSMCQVRKDVISEMVFNMGFHGFSNFHDTIKYLACGDYHNASLAMLDSAVARQLTTRYDRLSSMMATGVR